MIPDSRYHIFTGPAFFFLTNPSVSKIFRYFVTVILLMAVFSAISIPDNPDLLSCKRPTILCFTSSRVYRRYMNIQPDADIVVLGSTLFYRHNYLSISKRFVKCLAHG